MIKQRLVKYLRWLQMVIRLNRVRHQSVVSNVSSVGVLVAISPDSKKYKLWHDGFTEAIKLLKTSFEVKVIYFDPSHKEQLIQEINETDFLIVKSGWRSPMDYFLREQSERIRPYLGLMISSSNHVPSLREQRFYHVLWFETNWYQKRGIDHPNAFHGFGIDTEIMKPSKAEKKYDYITVGAPRKYKRLHRLLNLKGKRLLLGDLNNTDASSRKLLEKLREDGVVIEDFQDYSILAARYQASKVCFIPCQLHGGGERSLLEARACGLQVQIPSDNAKLRALLEVPIWDAPYYSNQLRKGIESVK